MKTEKNRAAAQGRAGDENGVPDGTKSFADRLFEKAESELPPAAFPSPVRRDCTIRLSDGVPLETVLFLPEASGAFPAVLVRNPYRGNQLIYARLLPLLAQQGYAVVLVSVRGALGSGGEWLPFEHERSDGREVLDWVASQPWCNKNIGAWGASYLGIAQWSIADAGSPALKTLFMSVCGAFGYELFYRRGLFRQSVWTVWALQMMEENRFSDQFPPEAVQKALEYRPQSRLGEELKGKRCAWYENWVRSTRRTDPYWSEGFWGELQGVPARTEIPVMLCGGWFDIFQRPQLASWRALPEQTRKRSRYVIGPWGHSDPAAERLLGKPRYPEEDILGTLQLKAAVEWFDCQLKGKPYPHGVGTMETYSLHDNRWVTWAGDIGAGPVREFYLDAAGGSLQNGAPERESSASFVYDPQAPAPSFAMAKDGVFAVPGLEGNRLRAPAPGARKDTLTFFSGVLGEDLAIAGAIRAVLFVSSSAPATAFSLNVMETDENGGSDSIREDITDIRFCDETRVEAYTPGRVVRLEFTLTDVMWRVRKGSRLRVDISSSGFPMYHVHPDKTGCWADLTDGSPAEQTVYSGARHASKLSIPVLKTE